MYKQYIYWSYYMKYIYKIYMFSLDLLNNKNYNTILGHSTILWYNIHKQTS